MSTTTCLLPMVDASTWYQFKLYRHYKNGILLIAGGLLDQPNRYLEMMELIDRAVNDA